MPGFERLIRDAAHRARRLLGARAAQVLRGAQATGSPIAAEALRRIAELYAIETTHPRPDRRAAPAGRASHQDAAAGRRHEDLAAGRARIASRRAAAWPKRSATPWPAGTRSAASSTTAASSSTTTPSSAPSGRSRSAARTICSPARMAAPTAGPSSARCIATAKLNDVEPFAYLKDVLERMTNGHPDEPARRAAPVELGPAESRRLTHVSGMDAYS